MSMFFPLQKAEGRRQKAFFFFDPLPLRGRALRSKGRGGDQANSEKDWGLSSFWPRWEGGCGLTPQSASLTAPLRREPKSATQRINGVISKSISLIAINGTRIPPPPYTSRLRFSKAPALIGW